MRKKYGDIQSTSESLREAYEWKAKRQILNFCIAATYILTYLLSGLQPIKARSAEGFFDRRLCV